MSAPIPLPYSVTPLPSKEALVDAYVGKNINDLRTPALVIDRGLYKVNAEAVIGQAKNSGVKFRAHIKSEWIKDVMRQQKGDVEFQS